MIYIYFVRYNALHVDKVFQPSKVFKVGLFIGRSAVLTALEISLCCNNRITYICDKDNNFYLDELELKCDIQVWKKYYAIELLGKVSRKEDKTSFTLIGALKITTQSILHSF